MAKAVVRSSLLIPLILLLAALLVSPVRADGPFWERDGLDGLEARDLLATPDGELVALVGGARDPTPLWLRTVPGWRRQMTGAPAFVLALATLPEGGLLLGTGRDISDQPGVFWFGGDPPTTKRLYDAQAVGSLAVAPGPAGVSSDVYAAASPWADRDAGPLLIRRDAATGSWTTVHHGSLACAEPSYFRQVVAATGGSTVLALEWCLAASSRQTQLWRSDDRGQTWRMLPPPVDASGMVGWIALDPTDADVLYLTWAAGPGAPAGLERSVDGGQSWTPIGTTVGGLAWVRSLAVDPRDPRRIIAAGDQTGVFMSTDRGESWAPLPGLEGSRVWSLVVDPLSARLFAATSDGVWRLPLP
jgi:hypothetical protein